MLLFAIMDIIKMKKPNNVFHAILLVKLVRGPMKTNVPNVKKS